MQFSMIFEAQLTHPTPEREREVIHDCVEQAILAEAAGFDRVWTVEHQMGTVPQLACLETIRIWGERVIPHFRRRQERTVGVRP